MKLHFLGTCAGTEPMPDRKHSSFAMESGGKLYWFDAGEGCSYTAHNMGLDLQQVHRIIISHPHMDHVGGLCNLLWNLWKLYHVKKRPHGAECVHVHIPSLKTWEGVMLILSNSECGHKLPYSLQAHETQEGLLFDDGTVRVTAFHNNHLPPRDGKWVSFSFLIECEGKRVVYSGDVKTYSDLDPVISNGCDGLIIETGHFKIDETYTYCKDKPIKKVYFTHNGREFLHFPEASYEKVRKLFGASATVCYDGMTESL